MNQRSADLAGGSRHNHLQPNLLKPTGIALPREKELICYRYRTVSRQDRKGEGKWGNLECAGAAQYSYVCKHLPPRNLIEFN